VAVMTTRERVKRLEIRLAKLYLGIASRPYRNTREQEIRNIKRLIRRYQDQIMERDL